jgi:outer membrane protein TolC
MLDYLTEFSKYSREALLYYLQALHHLGYIRCYENKLERLESLLAAERLRPADRGQVQAKADRTRVALNDYKRAYRTWVLILLQVLGIEPGDDFMLVEPEFNQGCAYLDRARTEAGRRAMVAEAFRHNPTFEVLADAIKDARLQHRQAVLGKYDITAYVQGTQFPMASEGFDDRVDGWQIGAGLSMRVNDQRVLSATRNKAQAQILEYSRKIDAERLRLKRLIATQSKRLMLFYEQRPTVLKNIATNLAEYEKRREAYLARARPLRTIEEVHTAVDTLFRAEMQRYNNAYYASLAERNLMAFTGEIYRLVGLEIDNEEEEPISGLVRHE